MRREEHQARIVLVGEVDGREVVGAQLVGVAVGRAALVAIGERRLVAVVAVDDRERPAADDVDRDALRLLLADPPEAVEGAFLVRRLEERGALGDERLERLADAPRRDRRRP